MPSVYADVLQAGVGIAISPIPIIGAVLILLSPRARSAGLAYALGWTLGLTLLVLALTQLSTLLPTDESPEGGPVRGILRILLSVALIVFAIRVFRRRPRDGQEPRQPGWMTTVQSASPIRALVLGAGLAIASPKNIALAIGAAVSIGRGGEQAPTLAPIIAMIAISSVSIVVPVFVALFAAERLGPFLEKAHTWLLQNNAVIMTVVLLVFAANNLGHALDAF